MRKIAFLNSPCQPKKVYHCGNAISQIVSDICVDYFSEFKEGFDIYYVKNAWNLHGLPFEQTYLENMTRSVITKK